VNPLRWAVVGLGVGEYHAQALGSLRNARLVALCDHDEQTLIRVSRNTPGAKLFTDPIRMLSECDLDVLVVATFDASHGALVRAALSRGVHVFAEKPLATSIADLDEIVRLLNDDPRLRLTTNTLLRLSPRFAWLKDQIARGVMGRVFHSELTYLYGRLEKVVGGWRGADPNYSVTLGGSIHMIDLLLWLTRERPHRCIAVGSSLGTLASDLTGPTFDPPQDLRLSLLEFPSGMTAQVGANYACVTPHFHSVAVFGSEKSFFHYPQDSASAHKGAVIASSRDPLETPEMLDLPYPAVPKATLVADFQQAIRGAKPTIPEQDVIDAMSVALAIDAAVRTGQPVDVSYVRVEPRREFPKGE
jgi:predicted dehydrogenase